MIGINEWDHRDRLQGLQLSLLMTEEELKKVIITMTHDDAILAQQALSLTGGGETHQPSLRHQGERETV